MNRFQDILNKTYNLQEFKQNILLPVFQHNTAKFQFYETPFDEELNESEKRIAESITQYGELTTHDGVSVNFYEVKLQPNVVIEHNRVTIGNLIRKLLLESAALVNFVYEQNDKSGWRFSFIFKGSIENKETEQFEDYETEPKRYTYLLGQGESCRTIADNLQKIADNSEIRISDIEKAFSVEALSKEFFNNYKYHYELFVNHIINSPSLLSHFNDNEKEKQVRDFIKKMLGRIVFLYFIQKKGWLGASTTEYKDGKQNFISDLFNNSKKNELFYADYLEDLFYQTLNTPRKDDICIINGKDYGKVPFLNGGLFEPEFKNGHLLTFPPELFKNLFNFFDSYNFTVIENDPQNRNVAVDPEMLGHIFENLLEDNKDKGAYYTPKEIVHYMCQESLIEYLNTKLNAENNRTDLEQFIKYKKENDFVKQNSKHINAALDNVKICDPAIGSGAFPVGLLSEIYTAKQALQEISENDIKKENPADIKQYIIQNSIYGVDIEKGAVDIARLRFWLSLIIDEEKPKPLPNLDYKIVVGNSLVPMLKNKELLEIDWSDDFSKFGTYGYEIAIEINKLLKEITKEQKDFFDPETKNKNQVKAKIENLKIDLLIKQLELKIKTRGLERVQSNAKGKTLKQQTELYLKTESWKKAIKKLEIIKKNKEKHLEYFNWKLDFAEILNPEINNNPGFDIVIGNPPYVRADNPQFTEQRAMIMQSGIYETLWEKWDLMVPFIEKGLKLLNPTGNFSFIVSNSITTSKFALKLQDWIIENFHILSIDYFENVKVFDAGVVPVILRITANKKNKTVVKKILRTDSFENKKVKKVKLDKTNPEAIRATLFKKRYNEAFNPEIKTVLLGNICYLSVGMVTNANEKIAQGDFVKEDLISDIKDAIHNKEYVEGKNIKEYKIEKIKYIEYNTERVPDQLRRPTFRALYQGDKILRGRVTKGTFDNTGIVCNDSIIVMKRFVDLHGVNERSIISSISKNNLTDKEKKLKGNIKKSLLIQRRKELEELSKKYSLKYILAVINSKYAMAYLNNFRRHRLKDYFYPDDFRDYPIPVASEEKQKILEILVNYLLYLNKDEISHLPQSENILTSYFEQIINGCVYELYFPETLAKHNRGVFKHLKNLSSIDIERGNIEIETIAKVFNTLYAPNHPLRKNLYYMDSIQEIRIVEGKHIH